MVIKAVVHKHELDYNMILFVLIRTSSDLTDKCFWFQTLHPVISLFYFNLHALLLHF